MKTAIVNKQKQRNKMMIHNLSNNNTIFNQFVAELRDVNVQNDSMRFRRNLERMGEVFAYEISKTLVFNDSKIQTPLGEANCNLIKDQPVIATILRAGLPLHIGLLNYFDKDNRVQSIKFNFFDNI